MVELLSSPTPSMRRMFTGKKQEPDDHILQHYVAQASLRPMGLLHGSLKCWDHKSVLPHPVLAVYALVPVFYGTLWPFCKIILYVSSQTM